MTESMQAARQMSGLAQADSDGPAEDDDTATAIQLLEARDAELSTELDGLECRWDLLHNPTELAALRTRQDRFPEHEPAHSMSQSIR